MPVVLDQKEEYTNGRDKFEVQSQPYEISKNFDKVVHTPKNSSAPTFLYFRKSQESTKNENYFFYDTNKLSKVEIYFSIDNETVPLVLVVNTNGPRYYEFSYLNSINSHKPINLTTRFRHQQLFEKLIDENTIHNNVITFRLDIKQFRSYGNNSIQVSEVSNPDFKGYSHIVQSKYQGKTSYVMFKTNLIKLETINDIPADQLLDNIQEKKLSSVSVYYKKEETDGPPVFLELNEHSTKKKFCLLKVDKEGLKWKQLDNESGNINIPTNRTEIIKETEYYKNKSIVILANKISGEYSVNLVDNDISAVANSEALPEIKEKIIVSPESCVSISGYNFYKHDMSKITAQKTEKSRLSSVTALQLFIVSNSDDSVNINNEYKINTFDKFGKKTEPLYLDPFTEFKTGLHIYFHSSNPKIPLMISHGTTYYKPNGLDDYFLKWIQAFDLRLVKLCDASETSKIRNELNKIIKSLNHINIKNTEDKGYGIFDNITLEAPKGFEGKIIDVTKDPQNQKFLKITHTPTNKSTISKIKFGQNPLQVDGRAINVENNKTVSVYYHNSDSKYQYPLLIYLSCGGDRYDFFYERETSDSDILWKRAPDTHLIKNNNEKISQKINNIRYTIGKSFVIQVDQQLGDGGGSGNSYPLKLVQNTNGAGENVPQSVGVGNITVKKGDCTTLSPPLNYICFIHTIPTLTNDPSPSDPSGLRFYVHENELTFSNSSGNIYIYFIYNNFQVHVYFHTDGEHIDNVPLLVGYDGKYYGPKSKDDYFNQWVLVDTNKLPSGDNSELESQLNSINKTLNEVNISITKGGSSYGLTKPKQSNGIDDTFCNRINVQHEDRLDFYKKVVHSTINQGPIGQVSLSGNKINGIELSTLGGKCNKLEVYYHTSDSGYTKPLLINIKYQSKKRFCNHWYYRDDLQGNKWKYEVKSNKYQNDSKIREELQSIQSKLSNSITVQLENQQNHYPGCITKGGDQGEKKKIGEIKVDYNFVLNTYKVDKYRCFEHQLYEYYEQNKNDFVSSLKLEDNPTLELAINIKSIKISLHDIQGKQVYLYYTNEMVQSKFSVHVYFFDPGGLDSDDKVPLLFIFDKFCFCPETKETYFNKWKQMNIDFVKRENDIDFNQKIKIELDRITRMLNVINLEKTTTGSYEKIEPGNLSDPLEAVKRVTVTRYLGTGHDYRTVTHSTAKTGWLGTVNYQKVELMVIEDSITGTGKPWSIATEAELTKTPKAIYNELKAYYYKADSEYSKPLLIKISGTSVGFSRPPTFFYERNDNIMAPVNWKKATNTHGLERESSELTNKLTELHYFINKSIMIQIEKQLSDSSKDYQVKVVQNYSSDKPIIQEQTNGTITIAQDKCLSTSSYKCSKHTINSRNISTSDIAGLRFYLGGKEIETFDTNTQAKKSVFYNNPRTSVHVYFHINSKGMNTFPLMFRYNSQCFKPTSKSDYFEKWVYDSNIGTSKPQVSNLTQIDTMLNEIDLQHTGSGGGSEYGLDISGRTDLGDFNGNRITVKRDPSSSKFRKVVHTTNNRLQIGKIMYGSKELAENDSLSKTLSDAAKAQTSVLNTIVNAVTAYYHTSDKDYSTPLLLGFGKTTDTTGVVETGGSTAVTPKVFYKRENKDDITKWSKVGLPDMSEEKIASALEEILYNIGQSIVIYLESQDLRGYNVKVVENNSIRSSLKSVGGDQVGKITVEKSNNCSGPESESISNDYLCFTHKIPKLTDFNEALFIKGVKFYIHENNYLPTIGKGGWIPEIIYYSSENTDVKVYFYSNGHGPPTAEGGSSGHTTTQTQQPDKVPFLVEYGGKYFKPTGRNDYFNQWVGVSVSSGSDTTGLTLDKILDGINNDFNSIDISRKDGGTNLGYGIYPNGSPMCPCTDPKNFCDRVTVKRLVEQKSAGKYHIISHSTINKARIGQFYYGALLIKSISTTGVTPPCNRVDVYYSHDDATYTNPLLICLGQQTDGQAQPPEATTNTQCKKWYRRKGIDLTDWVAVEEVGEKFKDNDSIKKELDQILNLFKDYLYLEIENTKEYQAYVQAKTGQKQKVEQVDGGDGSEDNKIKVEDAGAGKGADSQVPANYKAYKHGLSKFYDDNKQGITEALKKSLTDNQLPEGSEQSQNPMLQLRLLIADQVISLVDKQGSKPAEALKYDKEQASESDDTGTDGKNDPVVYFYKTGGGRDGSEPDTVPLLFKYQKQYFGPINRESYFNTWQQVSIVDGGGGEDGSQTKEAIKKKLDDINRRLNEIDLSKTGGGRGEEYGLEKPPGINRFQTKRIQVTLDPQRTYTAIKHKTVNNFNIGPIKALGSCDFDNEHTKKLKTVTHNEAVSVYASGDTRELENQIPKLVLITESKGSGLASGTSTVHGYYDLSKGCPAVPDKIKFNQVKPGFSLDHLGDRATVKKNCEPLVQILEGIGIIKDSAQVPAAPPAPDLHSSGLHDGTEEDEEEEEEGVPSVGGVPIQDSTPSHTSDGQDYREKVTEGHTSQGLGESVGLGEGGNGERGPRGPVGPAGPPATPPRTEDAASGSSNGNTLTTDQLTQQQHQNSGGGNSESADGGGPGGGGSGSSSSSDGETISAQTSSSSNIGKQILEAFENPAVSGGTGGAVGVGVIGTVGAVV